MFGHDMTVTVLNRYLSDAPPFMDVWSSHIIEGACYHSHVSGIDRERDSSDCRSFVTIAGSDLFVQPSRWLALSADDKRRFFTLRRGDIVVCGEVLGEVFGAPEADYAISDILAGKYGEAFIIGEVKMLNQPYKKAISRHYKAVSI